MSVFVDTGVFVAHQNQRDANHGAATGALKALAEGRWGRAFTSDYVFDEALTLARVRTRSHREAMTVADRILGRGAFPRVFDFLRVTGPVFRDALEVFVRYEDHGLSFTDATTVALVHRRRLDGVLSFDRDFDGIVPRIEPESVRGTKAAR